MQPVDCQFYVVGRPRRYTIPEPVRARSHCDNVSLTSRPRRPPGKYGDKYGRAGGSGVAGAFAAQGGIRVGPSQREKCCPSTKKENKKRAAHSQGGKNLLPGADCLLISLHSCYATGWKMRSNAASVQILHRNLCQYVKNT